MGSAYFDAHSLWQLNSEKLLFTSVHTNMRADVCVVGAGISGLTTAYLLLKAGLTVVVLDRERLGLGETGLTSAHLSNALDEGYVALRQQHGADGARLAAESHTRAIDLIESIQEEENIDCDFRRVDGYLFLSANKSVKDLVREMEAANASGLTDVTLTPRAPLDLFDTGPALYYPRQGQFRPMDYINGLAEAIKALGGQIFTHSEATEIKGGRNAHVRTSQGFEIQCQSVVVATNTPINNKVVIHTKNPAYRSYLIGVPVPAEKVTPMLLWDTADPYHYLRFVQDPSGQNILLVGGEDHRTGQGTDPEEHFDRLHSWVKTHLDLDTRVVSRWSGQILEPVDGLAYIGRNPADEDNVFIITGDSGHGLTHGTLGGILVRDLILGRPNPWQKLYDPSRLHFRSLGTYIKEAAQSTAPYSDWLSTGDVPSSHQIEAGEGAVIREGLNKVAVYKDEMGRLYSCNAVCTHLGGIVRWNTAEKTWDCPCHGSRFDRFGQVLNGPAIAELEPVGDPREITPIRLDTPPVAD